MIEGRALITGASRGIGLAIAESLARRGWRLVLSARPSEQLEAAAASLREAGTDAVAAPADLRDPAGVPTLVEAAERDGPVDVLINNAGTAPSMKFAETTDAVLEEVLDLHVRAPFRLIRALLPGMVERGRGCIVQIASTAALRSYPFISAYTAAKHAMLGMARGLVYEQPEGVRVYAVCPGFVDTDITRQAARDVAARGRHSVDQVLEMFAGMNECKRLLRPDEISELVADLVDPGCAEPSGTVFDMDVMPPRRTR